MQDYRILLTRTAFSLAAKPTAGQSNTASPSCTGQAHSLRFLGILTRTSGSNCISPSDSASLRCGVAGRRRFTGAQTQRRSRQRKSTAQHEAQGVEGGAPAPRERPAARCRQQGGVQAMTSGQRLQSLKLASFEEDLGHSQAPLVSGDLPSFRERTQGSGLEGCH